MDELKRRALAEARADAAHEAHSATGAWQRAVVRLRSTMSLGRVLVSLPAGPREPLAAGAARDARYAFRRLCQAPAFTLFMVASLALGIGAASAIFALVHAVMGPPPGMADPARVVSITHTPQGSGPMTNLSWPDFEDLRREKGAFATVAGFTWLPSSYVAREISASGVTEMVTGAYFDVVGAQAIVGRTLRQTDDDPAAAPVAAISHRLWQRLFGGSDRVLGESIRINGWDYRIVGVLADDFTGLFNGGLVATSAWLPLSAGYNDPSFAMQGDFDPGARDRRWVFTRARLAQGASLDQAKAQISVFARRLDEAHPLNLDEGRRGAARYGATRAAWTVKPLRGRVLGLPEHIARGMVAALIAAVGLVLLVAATNLANLAVARATGRLHELSVRKALGASRFRLVRESLAESAMLIAGGSLLGLVVAWGLMQMLGSELAIGPGGLVLRADPHFDVPVLLWTMGAAALVLAVAGLAPALLSTRAIRPALASSGATTAGRWRGRRLLIALQVTVSLLLVTTAAAFVAHVQRQAAFDPGLDLDRLALAEIDFGGQRFDEPRTREAVGHILAAVRTRPGVASVSVSSGLPVSLRTPMASVRVGMDDKDQFGVKALAATPDTLRTFGVELLHGRFIDERDAAGPPSIVLDEATVTRFFGDSPAVGRRIIFERRNYVGEPKSSPREVTIVGIVAGRGADRTGPGAEPVAYLPFEQQYEARLVVSARAAGDPSRLVGDLRTAIAAAAPGLAVAQIGTGTTLAGPDTMFQQIAAAIAGFLGLFALALALAGLYGVMAQLVAARTREVGVRLALGATAARIQRMVVLEGLRPVVIGLVLGLGLGALALSMARATVHGMVPQFDVVPVALVSALFIASGLVACYIPARRAARTDPNTALKSL